MCWPVYLSYAERSSFTLLYLIFIPSLSFCSLYLGLLVVKHVKESSLWNIIQQHWLSTQFVTFTQYNIFVSCAHVGNSLIRIDCLFGEKITRREIAHPEEYLRRIKCYANNWSLIAVYVRYRISIDELMFLSTSLINSAVFRKKKKT